MYHFLNIFFSDNDPFNILIGCIQEKSIIENKLICFEIATGIVNYNYLKE